MSSVKLQPVTGGWAAHRPAIMLMNQSRVDGETWYTISCWKEVSAWIRECFGDQENQGWFENIDEQWHINMNVFDVNEKIYTVLRLKWT
jgi:hypothetical protein